MSWRWCFFLNVPVCLLAAALAHRMVAAVPGEPAQRLDVRGLALLAPAVGALVYGLSRGAVVALGIGAVLLAAFVVHALRTDDPLIDVRLFTRRSFAGATAMLFLLSASLFGSMVLIPLYVQQVLGAGALAAGSALVPQFAGTLVALTFVGRLADRLPARDVVPAGVVVAVLGTLPFTLDEPGAVLPGCGAVRPRDRVRRGDGDADDRGLPGHRRRAGAARDERAPDRAADRRPARRRRDRRGAAAPAGRRGARGAFGSTFWWSLALTAPALLPVVLLRTVR